MKFGIEQITPFFLFFFRYTEFEPILTAMCVKDVKKRSRLIWTNIFVCEEDIKKIRCFNIFNHKIEVEKGKIK